MCISSKPIEKNILDSFPFPIATLQVFEKETLNQSLVSINDVYYELDEIEKYIVHETSEHVIFNFLPIINGISLDEKLRDMGFDNEYTLWALSVYDKFIELLKDESIPPLYFANGQSLNELEIDVDISEIKVINPQDISNKMYIELSDDMIHDFRSPGVKGNGTTLLIKTGIDDVYQRLGFFQVFQKDKIIGKSIWVNFESYTANDIENILYMKQRSMLFMIFFQLLGVWI